VCCPSADVVRGCESRQSIRIVFFSASFADLPSRTLRFESFAAESAKKFREVRDTRDSETHHAQIFDGRETAV
jgi:hypothetical protein